MIQTLKNFALNLDIIGCISIEIPDWLYSILTNTGCIGINTWLAIFDFNKYRLYGHRSRYWFKNYPVFCTYCLYNYFLYAYAGCKVPKVWGRWTGISLASPWKKIVINAITPTLLKMGLKVNPNLIFSDLWSWSTSYWQYSKKLRSSKRWINTLSI